MIHATGHTVPARRAAAEPVSLFAAEGALLQLVVAVNGFANNLFADRLGASMSSCSCCASSRWASSSGAAGIPAPNAPLKNCKKR